MPRRTAARRAAGSIPAGAILALTWSGAVLAASPTPSPALGDPRSPGQGPGFVGDPLVAIGAVLLIGVLTLAATLAWVRLTAARRA